MNQWLTAMQNILILCHINLFPPTRTVNKALVNNTLDPSGIMWGINPFLNHHSVANIDSIGGCGNITCLYTPPLDWRTHTLAHTRMRAHMHTTSLPKPAASSHCLSFPRGTLSYFSSCSSVPVPSSSANCEFVFIKGPVRTLKCMSTPVVVSCWRRVRINCSQPSLVPHQ